MLRVPGFFFSIRVLPGDARGGHIKNVQHEGLSCEYFHLYYLSGYFRVVLVLMACSLVGFVGFFYLFNLCWYLGSISIVYQEAHITACVIIAAYVSCLFFL